jgi:hypothetical protein
VTTTSWIYVIAGCAGVFSLAAWAWLIVVPAVTSYSKLSERIVAVFLSVYVLAAFVALGGGAGALFLYYFDEL